MSTEKPIFRKIDNALAQWYKSLGQPYNELFYKYVVDNDFEEDDIEEELHEDDCSFPDFDENFPLPPTFSPSDENEKIKEIVRIIEYCWKEGNAPPIMSWNIHKDLDLNINSKGSLKLQQETKRIYQSQCPEIYKSEETLSKYFAISMKNKGYPFLINLTDSYRKDLRDIQRRQAVTFSLNEWTTKSPYLSKLKDEKKELWESLVSGLNTWVTRTFSPWMNFNFKIHDDTELISKWISLCHRFVIKLLSTTSTAPFQIDFVFNVNSMKIPSKQSQNEDDDDDDNTQSNDDNENKNDEFGDIERNLKANKCPFYSGNLNIKQAKQRDMDDIYNKYKNQLGEHKHYKDHKKELSSYPQHKRFCVFIDRTNSGKSSEDKITFYEPHIYIKYSEKQKDKSTYYNVYSIPKNYVSEWFINSLKSCVVPGYTDHKRKARHLKADATANGKILVLSYHIESSDQMRVYTFYAGKCSRIFPAKDLNDILKEIMDNKYKNNNKWKGNTDFDKFEVNDKDFERFYHSVSIRHAKRKHKK